MHRPAAPTPYLDWFGRTNGRVVIELHSDQVEVIGKPIPACESDPLSRQEQGRLMAGYLAELSQAVGAPAVTAAPEFVPDPQFTHWMVVHGRIVGEAHSVTPTGDGFCSACVRLLGIPYLTQDTRLPASQLQPKR